MFASKNTVFSHVLHGDEWHEAWSARVVYREVAFPESVKDVEITAVGNKRMIEPVGQSWDDWFDASGVSSDFMIERKQPEDQRRETMGC